jgi:hypothetical protein
MGPQSPRDLVSGFERRGMRKPIGQVMGVGVYTPVCDGSPDDFTGAVRRRARR